jgi:hypothetical protein
MKVAVYHEKEPSINVKLFSITNGGVDLCVVDEQGELVSGGYLLTLGPEGIVLTDYVGNFGFDLDSNGRLKVV